MSKRLVVDADSHKCENPVVLRDFIEPAYRDRLSFFRDRYGEQRFRILDRDPRDGAPLPRVFLQPDGLGKGTYRPYHEETTLGGLFNHVRMRHLDREGIDAQLIYGSITLGFASILDRELAVALCRAWNDYIVDDCEAHRDRLHPVAVLPLQDPAAAVAEMRRCVEELGMPAVSVAPHVPWPHPAAPERFPEIRTARHLSHPDFRPLLREAERLDVAVGIHGAPGVYLAGGAADQLDSFTLVHVFANRHMQQVALAKLVFDGVMEELPGLRFGFLEAGCGWLPDLMFALREHWEKRVVGLDPELEPRPSEFVAELLRERSGRGGAGLARSARGLLDLLFTRGEEEVSAEERERFLHEHPRLLRDPMEFLERGQIFVTFEPDDPAAHRLPDALGPVGERVACMAVDYGHWDATLKDCVGLVADRPALDARHADRLLGGNALELYGPRLRARLAASQPTHPRVERIAPRPAPGRFDPFRVLDAAEREAELRALRRLFEERDGPVDLERRCLPMRDTRLIAQMRSEWITPRPLPAEAPGRDLRALWCAAVSRVNEAENHGSRLEVERVFAGALDAVDPIELHVLLEERIHGRILKEVCRSCGIEPRSGRPPRLMRALIHGMQHLPDPLRYVLVLSGEALGCVVFGALRDAAADLLEPRVAARCQDLLDDLIADETLHARYCRARLGPTGVRAARRLAPLVARAFVHQVPELGRLGIGPRRLVAELRQGVRNPDVLAGLDVRLAP